MRPITLFAIVLLSPMLILAQQTEAPATSPATNRVEPLRPNPALSSAPSPAVAAATPAATEKPTGTERIITSGDLLEIAVYGAPDFAKQVRVADSGDISLPLIGPVHVGGLSVQQAEAEIRKLLTDGGYFTDPQVSIFARESVGEGISVLGEVQKPGIYPLPGSRNLFDAISAAGGTTIKAGNAISITHRNSPQQPQTLTMPPNQPFSAENNVPVYPGDTVVVSKAGIVYVVGDVRMPGGFVMENTDLTVLQAVSMAQGTNVTAKLDNTLLIRKSAEGPQQLPVMLSKIMAAKSPDIKLQPDDIVFVPRSAGKAAARRTLDTILSVVAGAAIYR